MRTTIVVIVAFVIMGLAASAWMFRHRTPPPTPDLPAFHFSPYLDLNLAVDGGLPLAGTFFFANTRSIIPSSIRQPPTGIQALTLAFATGECGHEHWGPLDAQKLAQANVQALQRAGLGYRIATGGADGVFTCNSQAGMDAFIRRYQSTQLLGFDFDIEGHPSGVVIQSLVSQVGRAIQRYPSLQFGFTLATSAASDGSLTPTGHLVMQAIARQNIRRYFINLMVMNYGEAETGNCVVRSGRCDMVASAILAVKNLVRDYRVPPQQIEITPMIGINDVPSNVLTLDDAHRLAQFARTHPLGGLHFWSLNRDAPCASPSAQTSARCHGVAQVQALAYTQAFARIFAAQAEHSR